MPQGKQESTSALRRQWCLARKIPRHPVKKTAAQLTKELAAEGFAVEKRTVERDLIALAEIFPTIECDDKARPYGWRWGKDTVALQLQGMTPSEALAFQMIERFIEPLLPASITDTLRPYLRASAKTLGDLSGKAPASSWAKKVRVVHPTQLLVPPKINSAVHRAVTDGLLLDRQMRIIYRKRGESETVTHVVNPLGLVQRGPITYFVVNQSLDPFFLVLHRISQAELLDTPAQRPPDFDLDRLIESGQFGFGDGGTVRLQAIFTNQAVEHLYEAPLATDQKLIPLRGKSTKVVATVPDNQQLEWWLLGFGDRVEILAPDKLRKRMARTAANMERTYRSR